MTHRCSILTYLVTAGLLLSTNRAMAQQAGCFDKIHDAATPRDEKYSFDLKFDRTIEGTLFSCILFIRASDARAALDDFRAGVLYDDEAAITRAVKFPLSATVYQSRAFGAAGKSFTIRNATEWVEFKNAHFNKMLLALVSCASVRNVELVASRTYAFMIGSGIIRFQQPIPDKYPRVTGVSLVPITDEMLVRYCAG